MASNKSDLRRPFHCAADDDPFPLPDYLAPIADRPQVDIRKFIDTPVPIPPPIPQQQQQQQQQQTQKQEQEQKASTSSRKHLPRTSIVAALQQPLRLSPPEPLPAPSFSTLLEHLPLDNSSIPQPSSSILNIAVYDSQSPTKSAQVSLPATTPLMSLINLIPCTARPNLACTPSSAVLYIGNALYHYALPRQTNYAAPIQNFLRKYSSTTPPPNLHPITPTSPTFEQLTLTLGVPYPFLHHADCEHLMIFTDLFRSYQETPSPTIHHRPPQVTPCDVCRHCAADRFTVADPLADASPFHYCENCFRTAHYSQQGQVFRSSDGFRIYPHHTPI